MFNGNGEFIGVDDPPPRAISIVNLLPKYLPIKWVDIFCSPSAPIVLCMSAILELNRSFIMCGAKKRFWFPAEKEMGVVQKSKSSINVSYQDVISFLLSASSEPV